MGSRRERHEFYIPVDGKLYETSEEVYRTYYKMKNQEDYREKLKKQFESSYDELEDMGFQIEYNSSANKGSAEDEAITTIMIENMLNKLSILNDYEFWLIQELYTYGKSVREISDESDVKKSTVWNHQQAILNKLRRALEE